MGTTSDSSTYECDAQLGIGVEEMVSSIQDIDLLGITKRTKIEETRMV